MTVALCGNDIGHCFLFLRNATVTLQQNLAQTAVRMAFVFVYWMNKQKQVDE